MQVVSREFNPTTVLSLMKSGVAPVLSKVLAARGVATPAEAALPLSSLLPYDLLKGAKEMAHILADAIAANKRLLIIADYDADGATACSVGVRGLSAFGANVGYLIPNRIEHGYGLTPEIVQLAVDMTPKPDFLITVDNGIASHAGIEFANKLGVPVLVTDHHLPAETVPAALCIVNPNQNGCPFPSKALAGCGAIYYVLWALQDELARRGVALSKPFDITELLPLVAIGTIADVVPLDTNNRILVNEGVTQIRDGRSFAGVDALALISGRNPRTLATSDVAFGIGPRINAAGRLETMYAGVDCLTTDSDERAKELAQQLHEINDRRKDIEGDMTEEATTQLLRDVPANHYTAVLHSSDWHQGVIGIVAGRVKERIWRPTFALADGKNGEIKGSGRSIPGFHLRDALDLVDKRNPGLLLKFGGHAMAAGVSIAPGGVAAFAKAIEEVAQTLLKPSDLLQVLEVDGGLDNSEMTLDTVVSLKKQVWGQAFPEPSFSDTFKVAEARAIGGGKHLKLILEKNGKLFQAVRFRNTEGMPPKMIKAVYKMDANTFRDVTSLQLLVEHIEAA